MFNAKITGDLEAWGKQAGEAAYQAVRAEIKQTTDGVYATAKALWPVRRPEQYASHPRGYSKSRLAESLRQDGDDVVGKIANDAGYAYQIKSRRVETPAGSQYEAAYGRRLLALLEQQQRIVSSGRIFRQTQRGEQSVLSASYRKNQRAIRRQAARAKDAKHVWTLLVKEPLERASADLRERMIAAIVSAVERVR